MRPPVLAASILRNRISVTLRSLPVRAVEWMSAPAESHGVDLLLRAAIYKALGLVTLFTVLLICLPLRVAAEAKLQEIV